MQKMLLIFYPIAKYDLEKIFHCKFDECSFKFI